MTVDVRATVLCTLGEVISGNLADESVTAGQGLIRCRGNVEIKGLITPAVGTKVAFAYERGGKVSRIPRLLRVLSSFADPFRNKTTVSLGCKLTYSANAAAIVLRNQPIEYPGAPEPGDQVDQPWPWPKPEIDDSQPSGDVTDPDADPFPHSSTLTYNGICWQYDDTDEADPNTAKFNFSNDQTSVVVTPEEQWRSISRQQRRKLPVSVSARYIAAKCLAALRISARSIPLRNRYAEDRFDLSNGYVNVLDELFASESYVAFLDEAEALVVRSVLTSPGAGPVFTSDSVIDLQPLNIGMLPGGQLRLRLAATEYQYDPRIDPRTGADITQNAAPVASNFAGPTSFMGSSVLINVLSRSFDPDGDPLAVASVSVDIGGTIVLNQTTGLCRFTPTEGFNGTAVLSYTVSDGVETSNEGKIYIQCLLIDDPAPLGMQPRLEEGQNVLDRVKELEAKADTEYGEDQARRDWEYDRVESQIQTVYVSYEGGLATYNYRPVTTTTSRYDVYDRTKRRYTVTNDIVARTNGALVKAMLEAGAVNIGSQPCVTIEETVFDYRPIYPGDLAAAELAALLQEAADRAPGEERIDGAVCTINGRCPDDLRLPSAPADGDRHTYGACAYEFDSLTNGWVSVDPDTEPGGGATVTGQPDGTDAQDIYSFIADIARSKPPARQVSTTYESLHNVMGRLNLPLSPNLYIVPDGIIKTQETIVTYSVSGGVTKTTTRRYVGQAFTQEGQQAFAAFAQNVVDTEGLYDLLDWASELVLENQETQTRYDSGFGGQGRPAANDRMKDGLTGGDSGASSGGDSSATGSSGSADSSAGGDAAAGGTSDTGGSAGGTTGDGGGESSLGDGGSGDVVDISPPFTGAPGVEPNADGTVSYVEPNAQGQGLNYARAHNAILRGNRYGLGLTVEAWALPRYPLDALYLQVNGIAGAYKANGMSLAFSSDGIIANVDAMLWGAAGGTLGNAWFSVAPEITTLPSLPSTTTATMVPVNSINTPDLFNPLSVGTLWADLPYGVAPTYAASMAPAAIVPLEVEIITVLCGVRAGLTASVYEYSLDAQTAADSFIGVTVGVTATVHYELAGDAASLTLTPQDAAFITGYSVTGDAVAMTLTPQDATLAVAATLVGDAVAMTMTPQDATLTYFDGNYTLAGDPVAMTMTPQAADLTYVDTVPFVTTGMTTWTFSDNDRTATRNTTGSGALIWGTLRSSGKYYAEITCTVCSNPFEPGYGIGTAGSNSQFLGQYATSIVWNTNAGSAPPGGSRYINTGFTLTSGPGDLGSTVGTVTHRMGIAVDFTLKRLWITKNGTPLGCGDPATNGTPLIEWSNSALSLAPAIGVATNGASFTIPTSLLYLPSGFSQW